MSDRPSDFIREMVAADVARGKHGSVVRTRFPPEPNGYLHIGHAKAMCLNFDIAGEFNGLCNLRMDDTNPDAEKQEYVDGIIRDTRWLGFDWGDRMFYASDYYGRLYEIGEKLIGLSRAFVCHCDEEKMGRLRGTVTLAGTECEHRSRSVAENLDLFRRMRAGEFREGECTLRAKIDMSAPNMKLRDPPLYRIKTQHHYRQGDVWKIYPLYDYAHCLSDSMEGITHSLCTTEYESARALYDWVLRAAEMPWISEQTEFARLNLSYTVMSKRKLLQLVQEKHVSGWDDPRMPTIAGLRRRGYTPQAIRDFCAKIGVSKNLSLVDLALLEHTLREDLEKKTRRALGVLRPLKVVIESFEGTDEFDAPWWPPDAGRSESRKLPFSREVYIEQGDFSADPPKDWKRLAPGKSVRLRHAFVVTYLSHTDSEVRVRHDPSTRGGETAQKGLGTLHWVDAARSIEAEVRLYDRLFTVEDPGAAEDFKSTLNPKSLEVLNARVEPSLASAKAGEQFQLERTGFFVVDPDSREGHLVLGRTVTLKDTWAPAQKAPQPAPRKEKPAPQKATPKVDAEAAAQNTLDAEPGLRALVNAAILEGASQKEATALAVNELLGLMRAKKIEKPTFTGAHFAQLVQMKLPSALAKDALAEMLATGGPPKPVAMLDDAQVKSLLEKVLAANQPLVAKVKAGNANVASALFGIAMRESQNRASPQQLRATLDEMLR